VIFLRIAGLFFAFVQISLVLRLLLPFVLVPEALLPYVPALIEITDLWIAPVESILTGFQLSDLAADLTPTADSLVEGPTEFEPFVLIAMLFWVVVTMFSMFVLRLVFRPGG
jgi:hypothetical protein